MAMCQVFWRPVGDVPCREEHARTINEIVRHSLVKCRQCGVRNRPGFEVEDVFPVVQDQQQLPFIEFIGGK